MRSPSPGANAAAAPIPARAGIGLRHRHVVDFLREPPAAGWIEVHSENYLSAGGPRLAALERIRRDFPLSCHGVGLSLGSADGLDRRHLRALRGFYDRFAPGLVSEHVAWSVTGGVFLNDLLPLPFTDEALAVICRNIDQAQEAFGRRILVENPSSYVAFTESTMAKWEFLRRVKQRYPERTILGSGDVFTAEDAVRMLAETGVDIVWIARGAIGNPWIFEHARALLMGSNVVTPPSIHDQREALREHFSLAMQIHGEQLAGRRMRKMGIKYSRFHPQAAEVKKSFINVRGLRDWNAVLDQFYTHDGAGVFPDPMAADEVNQGEVQSCDATV